MRCGETTKTVKDLRQKLAKAAEERSAAEAAHRQAAEQVSML
jgi:hypothetical protein